MPPTVVVQSPVDVVLTIEVDDAGKVLTVQVASSGGDAFDEAAVDAARQFEFDPATADGKPVPVRITYRYHFTPPKAAAPPAVDAKPPASSAPPDRATFLGRVLAKGDRVPLPGITLYLSDDHSETTDDDGRFRFVALPPGEYTVRFRGSEIRATETKLTIVVGQQVEKTYYLEIKQRFVTTVRGARPVEDVVVRQLTQDEIRRAPGTQGDTLKAVQNLPGVARPPFAGGQLAVWGSSPQDTRVYADGVQMPILYHLGGLRSAINGEMVNDLTFSPGGYSVDYGRGMGGLIQLTTRRPKTDGGGFHGYAQIDLFDASLLVEGPITKKLSFSVSARRSILDLILPHVTGDDFQLTPVYYDYQAKLHYRPTPRDSLELFVFGSDDVLALVGKNADPALAATARTHTYFHRVVGSWHRRFADGATLSMIGSAGYEQPFQGKNDFGKAITEFKVANVPWSLRVTWRQPVAKWLRLDLGLDYEGTRTEFNARVPVVGFPREGDSDNAAVGTSFVADGGVGYQHNAALFVAANFSFFDNRLTLSPQFRLELFNTSGYAGKPDAYDNVYVLPEPRLRARLLVTKWMAIKAAVGRYDQLADVATFSARIGNPNARPQTSIHYVAGFEFHPTSTLSIDTQFFYKDLRNLVVRSEDPTGPPLDNDGRGRVYGAELSLRQSLFKNFYGSIGYTISRSERKDHASQPWRVFQYDQTHILTLVASYLLPRGFQVGLRFRYATGNPYTPIVGSYFNSNRDSFVPIEGAIYSARVSAFHQLDVRFDKTFQFNRWKLSVYLDVQNVYNYRAVESYSYSFDYSQKQPLRGLPVLPGLGIRGDF